MLCPDVKRKANCHAASTEHVMRRAFEARNLPNRHNSLVREKGRIKAAYLRVGLPQLPHTGNMHRLFSDIRPENLYMSNFQVVARPVKRCMKGPV